jgi:hypothetical protein
MPMNASSEQRICTLRLCIGTITDLLFIAVRRAMPLLFTKLMCLLHNETLYLMYGPTMRRATSVMFLKTARRKLA